MTEASVNKSATAPWLPFVAPFAAFMILSTSESTLRAQIAGPWGYVGAYALKVAVVAGLLIYFRAKYPPLAFKGAGVGLLAGIAGAAAWIYLCQAAWAVAATEWIPSWLLADKRAGFNPYDEINNATARWAALALRFMGLVVVVPIMEELFWRGFLARWIVDADFDKAPVGRFNGMAFFATTLFFAGVHLRSEFVAALTWGAAINVLCMWTRNLWACITMHAATNLCLGIYIVKTGAWEMW